MFHSGVKSGRDESQTAFERLKDMKILFAVFFIGLVIRVDGQTNLISVAGTSGTNMETIVCIRHGEKPREGLGQLTCRGLNRALALPDVLLGKYGKPQFIFAPNPTQKVDDKGGDYYYVRPLITIEPTAIRCGLPVNTEFGFKQIKGLQDELEKPQYWNATVFIAWEHLNLDKFVKHLVKADGGNPDQVLLWPDNDYDSIFLIKITHSNRHESVAFSIDHEGLNNLSDKCP